MANITNDVNVSRDSFEEKHLQKHLEDIARNEDISNPKYCIESGSNKGDNYIGIVYRVVIEGEKNCEKVKKSFVFKCSPQDEPRRQLLQVSHFFGREVFVYEKVVPIFSDLLREHGTTLTSIPIVYNTSEDDHEEVIILEDLREKGFVMKDRLERLDYTHASFAIRHLGRFHAYSFALRDQKPDVFQKLTEMTEPFFRPEICKDGPFQEHTKSLANDVKVALAGENPRYTEAFAKFYEELWDEMEWCCNGALAEPYAVVNHGDFWTNNMMFRYNEGSSVPQEFYFLDFQIARYASPVLDLVYLLFCSCSQELRTNYFDQLILDYHNSLSECLIELGSDPKRLFPFDALTDQLEKFGKFGAGMAMFVTIGFTAVKDDIPDMEDFENYVAKTTGRIHEDHRYRNTLRDTMKDIIDRQYI